MPRIWKFADDVDTDQIVPGRYAPYMRPDDDVAGAAFIEAHPEFNRAAVAGDIIVAGENFGCGSSREYAPLALKRRGIGAIVAKSFARIFFRNAINLGIPVFVAPDVIDRIADGAAAEFDLRAGTLRVDNQPMQLGPMPEFAQRIVAAGGIAAYVRTTGQFPNRRAVLEPFAVRANRMTHRLCWIPGDGIGPEVTEAAIRALREIEPRIEVHRVDAGWDVFRKTGQAVPDETLATLRDCGAGLFGAVSSPGRTVPGYRSAILQLRQQLNLYANIRPIDGRWGNRARPDVRFQIVRENTEDLYVQRERIEGDTAIAERQISRRASHRIGAAAARLAQRHKLPRITIVHKANILPLTDGLFRDSARQAIAEAVLEDGEHRPVDEMLVDIAALRLVETPERFQTIVTTNVFGDILSDLAAYWCGGMRRAPSLNLGDGVALAEPVHGSAPDIAGQGIADPTAAILSLALLCRIHWELPRVAAELESRITSGAPA